MNLKILQKKSLGRETEAMLLSVEDGEVYQVSICITKLEKPYYANQLYRIFATLDEAQEFYEDLCEMREQDEYRKYSVPESGYLEKVINVERLQNGNFQVMARAFPTRKRKVQIITMEFSQNGFNALVGSLMAMSQGRE